MNRKQQLIFLIVLSFSPSVFGKKKSAFESLKEWVDVKTSPEFDQRMSDPNSKMRKLSNRNLSACWAKKKQILYPHYLNLGEKLPLEIAGIKLKSDIVFFIPDDKCKNLYPNHFESTADQKFLGVNIKKGEFIYLNTDHKSMVGFSPVFFDKDGYAKFKKTDYKKNPKELNSIYYFKHSCLVMYDKSDSQKRKPLRAYYDGVYYKKEEIMPASDKYASGPSIYFGHKICLGDNKKAKITCPGSYSNFTWDFSEKQLKSDYAIANAKKCNKKIKDYEKRTGKKVPYSPLLTEEQKKLAIKGF